MTTIATKTFSDNEINFLTEKLKQNPASPLFARLADALLSLNKTDEALLLCQNGIEKYPDYAAAYVVLGKINLKLGNFISAKNNFLTAIQKSPTNQIAVKLIQNIPEEKLTEPEKINFPQFEEFEKTHEVKIPENELITIDEFLSIKKIQTEEENINQMDELAQLLSQAEKITPVEVSENSTLPDIELFEPFIVTPTLAEIYANQEEFSDAIELYKTLIQKRPDQKDEFVKRIEELKLKAIEVAKLKKEGK
ncbi:MAG: tetratricopeptide repeat protein [Bacteroidetes bacterium]|nr:tetratricopeptide repeat protein [Bacteroidota bacterium]